MASEALAKSVSNDMPPQVPEVLEAGAQMVRLPWPVVEGLCLRPRADGQVRRDLSSYLTMCYV